MTCHIMHEYSHDSGWEVVPVILNGRPAFTHIVPSADVRRHQLDPSCWCDPVMDDETDSYGADIWIHNSADNRESFEVGIGLKQ